MESTEGGTGLTLARTIDPLWLPAHPESRAVTSPRGKSEENIIVEAEQNAKTQPNFWDRVTNASGNCTIEMNVDRAGNPWTIDLKVNPFLLNIISLSQVVSIADQKVLFLKSMID